MKNFKYETSKILLNYLFTLIIIIVITPTYSLLYAQSDMVVSGVVKDSETGEGIPGVNVIIKGTAVGTATGIMGDYSLQIEDPEAVLIFSNIGFGTQEIKVGTQSVIDITLTPDTKQLNEVVVTALGVKKDERALGYSVQQVKTKGLDQAKETNIVNALTGKIAGVQINNSSGNIGGSSRITIRGINSISGNNQPLFVVDGTPIDNSNFNSVDQSSGNGGRDYGNAAQDINPDDIEAISVLKGPSAAALYGSRASNGVILITTKSGQKGKGIGISVNSSTMFSKVNLLPDMQNEYGGGFSLDFEEVLDPLDGKIYKVANTNANNSWGPRFDGTPVRHWDSMYPGEPTYGEVRPWQATPNNIRDFFETGVSLSNNISFTGGTEKSAFRLSYTNLHQKGVFPNSSIDRNTFTASASTDLTDKLTVGLRANFVRTEGIGRPATGDWSPERPVNVMTYWYAWTQRQIDPARLRRYKSERYPHMTWNVAGLGKHTQQSYNNNPYFTLYESYNNDLRNRVFGNIYLTYDILPELTFSMFARTDFYTDRREDRAAIGGYLPNAYEEGIYEFSEDNYEFLFQYDKDLSPNFSLMANFGGNLRLNKLQYNFSRTQGGLSVPNFYNLEASVERPTMTDFTSEKQVQSLYGSVNLGYKDFIFLEGSLRNDWSSTLPAGNNSYQYPAVSTSFVFSNLLTGFNVLSFGKVRAGWAQVGNDTDPYRLAITYQAEDAYGNSPAYTVPNILNNSDLKPELTSNFEAGIDLRFLENRLGVDFTYYYNVTTDQILPLSVSKTTGYESIIVNAGKLENKGVELMIYGTPIKTANFSWELTVNVARNRNKVLELAEGQDTYEVGSREGNSINAKVGEPYGTIIGPTGVFDEETGKPIVDENGLYLRAPGQVIGNIMPDYTGGFSSTFNYKGISLNALIDFQIGGEAWIETIQNGKANGQFIESVGNNENGVPLRNPVSEGGGVKPDAVTINGEPNTVFVEAQDYFKQFYSLDGFAVFDMSYAKLRQVMLGYTFPKKFYENIPIESLQISFVARNIGLLYKNVPHIDPAEIGIGSDNVQGLEGASLPAPRTLGFNLNFKL